MKVIGLASDHAGYPLKEQVKEWLTSMGYEYKDFGTNSTDSCNYPEFGHALAQAVESGECPVGIAICGTGNGINMSVNHHKGIRGALCWMPEIAALARQHNDANILCFGERVVGVGLAIDLVDAFLEAEYLNSGNHVTRVKMISDIEKNCFSVN